MNAKDLAIILKIGDVMRSICVGYIVISILFGLYIRTSGFAIYFMTYGSICPTGMPI
ncbi:hypothetical protein GYMLUDRAFT_247699 [Collybiopsis luxurians FD-317 M1]|uniref:Uncharacterized protein n=1 Tax=Collybiopsis luxurians FD-317 M1 TaxID=944289 RepID=A0A0D0CN44_9AGAR|nr:hypothetical protein GYMLUDRAFT_247699 [Collybiopsis luxurians FD-317 M1]